MIIIHFLDMFNRTFTSTSFVHVLGQYSSTFIKSFESRKFNTCCLNFFILINILQTVKSYVEFSFFNDNYIYFLNMFNRTLENHLFEELQHTLNVYLIASAQAVYLHAQGWFFSWRLNKLKKIENSFYNYNFYLLHAFLKNILQI